jgi:LuxR family transcriptional regulator, maltose regulon positive regulatory protein
MAAVTRSSSLVRRQRLDSPIFRAKFRTPGAPRHLVRRQRLIRLLNDLAEYPVTLIAAPAGVGKTALAAEWSRQCGHDTGWLALDRTDREPAQLWHSITSALDALLPGAEGDPLGQGSGAFREPFGDARRPHDGGFRATLVIDDIDQIDGDERASAALAWFVAHRPAPVHLLLLSRRRPALPIERLRVDGDLADIHFEALRFSEVEAADLLMNLCPDISAADLSTGVDRAGGWAAALQLTALTIRSHRYPPAAVTAPGEAGLERLVDEYLWQEVLGSEHPGLLSLLLSASVVGRVNSGLAEALTQRPDAGDLLEEAEERGLFMTSLGENGWFEMHSLVRDMLTARFRRRWPAALREQHGRAAQWFESVGDELSALDQWLLADRPDAGLRVLADLALGLHESGRGGTITRGLAQLPPEVATADVESAVRYAWCQLTVDRGAFVDALSVARSAGADAGPRLRLRLDVLDAAVASMEGDWVPAGAIARAALERAEEQAWVDPIDPICRFAWRLVTHEAALAERWDDAAPTVARARAASSNGVESRWSFEGTRAIGLALAGHPLDAQRVAAGARQVAGTGRHATLSAELALADALVAREIGDRPGAEAALLALGGRPVHLVPSLQLVAQLELVLARLGSGRQQAAAEAFEAAEVLCGRLSGPPSDSGADPPGGSTDTLMTSAVARVGVDLLLATGDVEAAERSSRRVVDAFWRPVCEAKVQLALNRPQSAAEALAGATPRCARHRVVHDLLTARAVAHEDRAAAASAVRSAISAASRRGMLESVACESTELVELLELAAWCAPDEWMGRLRHAVVPACGSRGVGGLVEELTDRERQVLRLLPSRLTLHEIASELFVSRNTLKFHLRAIYRKLGVASRAAAVDAARELRLLPGG